MFPNPQDALPLPARPNLEQYKKLAKDLIRTSRRGGVPEIRQWAATWVNWTIEHSSIGNDHHFSNRSQQRLNNDVAEFIQTRLQPQSKLSNAQFVIARCHGFTSWPKFVRHLQESARPTSPVCQFEKAADAIVRGDVATLRRLLRNNPKLVHQRSQREHRATLLHYVSANGVEGYRQQTPGNIVEVAELLLQAGADVDAEADVYGGGSTTLGLTATSCHPEEAGVQEPLMRLLISYGAVIDRPQGGSPQSDVVACLANGRGAAAEYLAANGAALDLEGAAGVGRLDVVKTFFREDGTLMPPATELQLRRGFMWACEFGREDVVAYLLDRGVDPAVLKTTGGRKGITGLHWAAYGCHSNIVRLLLQRGASVHAKEQAYGGTPLGWALYAWGENPGKVDCYEVIAMLARAGATVDWDWLNERSELAKRIEADPRMSAALCGLG
jgi:ankyrin repeat protein